MANPQTVTESESKDSSPYTALSDEQLGLVYIDLRAEAEVTKRELAEVTTEIMARTPPGESLVVPVPDPDSEMPHIVTLRRQRGSHRWDYNAKQVLRRLETLKLADTYSMTVLDEKMFKAKLDRDDKLRGQMGNLVSSEYGKDKIVPARLNELLKARGL